MSISIVQRFYSRKIIIAVTSTVRHFLITFDWVTS